jgi:3-methyladenine DNA glycosylase/8-oxoguanine DNA glycosylase
VALALAASSDHPIETRLRPVGPLDLERTLAPLRHGTGDPTIRFDVDGVWRATRTRRGPATVWVRQTGDAVVATAWGAGARLALDGVPALIGEGDDPAAFVPRNPLLRELQRQFAGVRMTRTDAMFEALLPAVVEQKVTGIEARRAYRYLVRAFGEPAPGPRRPLFVAPSPERLARMPYHVFHPFGIERRRADTIRRAAARAARLEEARAVPGAEAQARLRAIPGIGAWTAAEVVRVALGDPDAVSVGDYHLPSVVSWALAGEARADDNRMLELLEPYRGQRGRAVRLLELAGITPPAFGPRMPHRSIAAI